MFFTFLIFSVPQPSNFSLVEIGLTSITVKWQPIPPGSTNGLLGYRLKYKKYFQHGEYSYLDTASDELQANITKLEMDTVYSIQVAGVVFSGFGDFADEIIVQTKTCKLRINL